MHHAFKAISIQSRCTCNLFATRIYDSFETNPIGIFPCEFVHRFTRRYHRPDTRAQLGDRAGARPINAPIRIRPDDSGSREAQGRERYAARAHMAKLDRSCGWRATRRMTRSITAKTRRTGSSCHTSSGPRHGNARPKGKRSYASHKGLHRHFSIRSRALSEQMQGRDRSCWHRSGTVGAFNSRLDPASSLDRAWAGIETLIDDALFGDARS
ncbi:MAG: hypothetical protein HLUCCO17_09495 [Saliniramus fredricksonii]|uniref:Uncharacterized protein n=1 Tax=Saliniramus fredricksonii TaxID=1653334 RepID=A0A0P7X752_9HYPH|nr:MAG: hypothetical protein HLUCCO17_09495 [Saliniramus fredricksonii]SCC81138.1 hypothetical protein GA0071312_2071 [Saliniramus fredricksonii]